MPTSSSSTPKTSPGVGCLLYALIALFGAAVGYRAHDYSDTAVVLGAMGLLIVLVRASSLLDTFLSEEPYNSPKRAFAIFFPAALIGSSIWAAALAFLASRSFWQVFLESLAAGMMAAVVFFGVIVLRKRRLFVKTSQDTSWWE